MNKEAALTPQPAKEDDDPKDEESSLLLPPPLLWRLPDTVLFHILCFAAPPTHRATVVCHQLAPLEREATETLLRQQTEPALWEIVLRQDYGVRDPDSSAANIAADDDARRRKGSVRGKDISSTTTTRRACKRLRRSILQRVQTAHKIVKDNTEIAFFYLHEMVNANSKQRCLTKAKLRSLLAEYGPLRVNAVVSSGGLFLVEICRARQASQATMLACVKELVESHGAVLVNGVTYESASSRHSALAVAAVRGLPLVVKYLLEKGANPHVTCTGRFRVVPLLGQPQQNQPQQQQRASIYRQDATPLEFAQAMLDAQITIQNGQATTTTRDVLLPLKTCIRLLQKVSGAKQH